MRDLATEGFPLAGGRLDYLENRTVAVLVYHRALHSINLYVRPARDNGVSPVREQTIQGYNVLAWKKNAFEFRAVSDLKPKYFAISCAFLRRRVWQTIHSFLGLVVFALRQNLGKRVGPANLRVTSRRKVWACLTTYGRG
jgi:hypothetical protein